MFEILGAILLVGALAFVALALFSVCLAYFTQATYVEPEDWHEHDSEF